MRYLEYLPFLLIRSNEHDVICIVGQCDHLQTILLHFTVIESRISTALAGVRL